jgi:hypothetical protein
METGPLSKVLDNTRPKSLSFCTGQGLVAKLQDPLCLLTLHRWKPFKKIFKRSPIRQIIPKRIYRNAGSRKNRPAAECTRVGTHRKGFQVFRLKRNMHTHSENGTDSQKQTCKVEGLARLRHFFICGYFCQENVLFRGCSRAAGTASAAALIMLKGGFCAGQS